MSEKFEVFVDGKRYSVEIESNTTVKPSLETDKIRDEKVKSTRNLVLTISTICAALTAFLLPVVLKVSDKYTDIILSVSIACYLLTILMGLVHVLVLYYQELYKNTSETCGDILKKPKRWLLKKHEEIKKNNKYHLVVSHLVVRGQFTLQVVGTLFLFGIILTLYSVSLTLNSTL